MIVSINKARPLEDFAMIVCFIVSALTTASLAGVSLGIEPSIKESLQMGERRLVRHVEFSPDGKLLAVACGNDGEAGEIRVYSPVGGRRLATLKGHTDIVVGSRFTPDGTRLISAGFDKKCLVWNTATWALVGPL